MKIEVTAFPRTQQGTGASRRLRGSGRVPGIIYGANETAAPVEFDHNALFRHLKLEAFHASVLDMTIDGAKQRVLLRDFQMHPWKQQVLHVDFQRIDPTKKIHMRVPLHFMNQEIAVGVKTGGGVVSHTMNEIEVQCLADDLPEYIEVDLKDVQLNEIIHVNDLKMPPGVEPVQRLKSENPTVASVHVPKVAAVEEEAAAPVTEITGQTPAEAAAAAAEADKGDKGDKGDKDAKK